MDVTLPVETLRALVRQPDCLQLFINLPGNDRRFHDGVRVTVEDRYPEPIFHFRREQDGRIVVEQRVTLTEVFELLPRLTRCLDAMAERDDELNELPPGA